MDDSDKKGQPTIQQLSAQVQTLTNMVAALIDQQKSGICDQLKDISSVDHITSQHQSDLHQEQGQENRSH